MRTELVRGYIENVQALVKRTVDISDNEAIWAAVRRLQHRVPHTAGVVYNSGNDASRADPARSPRRFPPAPGDVWVGQPARRSLMSR
jgi:hypothetical protein